MTQCFILGMYLISLFLGGDIQNCICERLHFLGRWLFSCQLIRYLAWRVLILGSITRLQMHLVKQHWLVKSSVYPESPVFMRTLTWQSVDEQGRRICDDENIRGLCTLRNIEAQEIKAWASFNVAQCQVFHFSPTVFSVVLWRTNPTYCTCGFDFGQKCQFFEVHTFHSLSIFFTFIHAHLLLGCG